MGCALSLQAATLHVSIYDEFGAPVAARVYLTDGQGNPYFPADTIRYEKTRPDGVSERHFVPRKGVFELELPRGRYQLTVERGKEYLPWSKAVLISPAASRTVRVRLRRFVHMAKRSWYAGDMHVHRPLTELPTLMEAEDLALAVPITRWKTNRTGHEDPELRRALGEADVNGIAGAGPGRFFPVLNEELEPRGSALLASGLGRKPVDLDYPLSSFGRSVTTVGGVSDLEKPTSLEAPALAALGAFETVGLVNNHLWRSGSFTDAWGAWPDRMVKPYSQTCAGFVRSGFDMYAALLNVGIPMLLSAGSASGVHPVPPGWSRVYVQVEGAMSAKAWYDGLRAGRSFVTTGPMLFLTVDGIRPGAAIHNSKFPLRIHASVEMLSARPLSRAEIVVNGAVHPIDLRPVSNAQHTYRGSLDVTVRTSSWIAARWLENGESGCDAAHSAPVYVWKQGEPIPVDRASAAMLLDRVERLIADVTSGRDLRGTIALDTTELRASTLSYLEQARQVYRTKLSPSSGEKRAIVKPVGPVR